MVKHKKYKVVKVIKIGEDTVLGDQTYRYLTADEMKSLGDDSLPIDVTRDERIDSNKVVTSIDSNMLPPQNIEDSISPEHVSRNYVEYIKKYSPDNVDINRHPINIGFLVSFLVDARGGAMRGCRHSGVRVIVPPRCAPSPTRITCRYVRPQRTSHPPPLMEGEALASRVLELGPVGVKFLGPVIIEVPHFAGLRGKEREIVILRSDNGESWKEHTVDATEEVLNEMLHDSFEAEDLNQMEDISSGRITRIVTQDFPQYFAVVSRVRQEVHAIGPEGGMVSSTVVPQVQAIFPEGALTKKIKVGLQAQPIDPELTAKLLGHGVAVSPVVTVEPRRRKFHKAIRLNMPAPTAHSQGMINQYSGSAPTLRLLCSITGGTTRAQWEDVTGSTPLTFVNDVVSFTTTVSARFWLMDCRNIGDATKMATELYKEAIHVPFMAKFVVFAKRVDPLEARLRVFCMTDDKEDKTLEHQEHFTEVAKSRDVEVLEGKPQYIEFAGNLVPITKSGEQLQFSFRAFRENRLPFSVRVKDQHAEAVGRCLFMRESKIPKGEPPQQPICILNIVLPDDIVTDTISLTDSESGKRHMYLSEFQDYYRPDPRLADMSNLLGEDWVELAYQLGLTPSEINVIKSEYPESIAKQAQSMLRMWLSQSGNKAQTNTLENALRRIRREDIIPQCLNVEQPAHTIGRIKEEEIGYRLKRKEDKDVPDKKKMIEHYDKYSAEEKVFEKSESEEEDNFDKTVTERREEIEKRLSAERAIPASSQRREIVQEISSIKRQSIVEDLIAEVKHKVEPESIELKTTTKPDSKTQISEIVEIKTTLPSDSKASEIRVSPEKEKLSTTKIIETEYKIVEEMSAHKPGGDSKFLEEVSQRFEGPKKVEQRIIGSEGLKSPKYSKTPPPSPADFLLQKQATSVQIWDATKKSAEVTQQQTPIEEDAAQQGKPTSTAQYLASDEDMSLIGKSVGQNLIGLSIDRNAINKLKPIFDQTNAFIMSESRAEPYHPHTSKHYIVKQEIVSSEPFKEEKKSKRGFFGTLKGFVSRSSDISDSDSEKTPKKEKKKKKKTKSLDETTALPQPPVRPPRKPKIPTPTEERKEYDDIPYMEAGDEPPSYAPPEIPAEYNSIDKQLSNLPDVPIEKPRPVLIEEVQTETITKKSREEKPSEEKAKTPPKDKPSKEEKPKTPKPKKVKTIIVDEQITKVFAPAAVEEEEFTIIVDPTKKESPKKSKETFTLNIDESIGQIEKEILEKSPILSEEKIVKPIAHIKTPAVPPRARDHYYEDIDVQVVSQSPEHIISLPKPLKLDDDIVKKVTLDLIENEKCFAAWADDYHNIINKAKQDVTYEKSTDIGKPRKKNKRKLFGVFSKSSKDTEESDDDSSKREVIEKQDSEQSEERSVEPEEHKAGFLGLFSKKHKKGEKDDIRPIQGAFLLSQETIKNMKDTTDFLKLEVEKYEDGKPINVTNSGRQVVNVEKSTEKPSRISKSKERDEKGFLGFFKKPKKDEPIETTTPETELKTPEDSEKPLKGEVEQYHDIRPISEIDIQKKSHEEQPKHEPPTKPKSHTSDELVANIYYSDRFLKEEVDKYHDVRPGLKKVTTDVKDEYKGKTESASLSDILKEQQEGNKVRKVLEEIFIDMKSTDQFLKDEINNYNDVKPITDTKSEIKRVGKTEGKLEISEEHREKKDSLGIFGLFKKHHDYKVKEQFKGKPNISDEVIIQMESTGKFLEYEVKKYHDVKPILSTISTESGGPKEHVKDKSETKERKGKQESAGIFSLLKKPDAEKLIQNKKPKISEQALIDMNNSNQFLSEEVGRYHDVRPIVDENQAEQNVRKEEKSKEKSELQHKYKDKSDSSGIFSFFKKHHDGESDQQSKEKSKFSEEIVIDMQNTDQFLKGEIDKYNDVRPIVEENLEKVKSTVEKSEQRKQIKDSPGIFGFFTKHSDDKAKGSKEKPNLSKQVISDMKNTDQFLKDEVDKYHDVWPTAKAKQVEPEVKKDEKKKEKSEPKDEYGTKDKTKSSEQLIINMKNTNRFLKDEVDNYHDVRPIVEKELVKLDLKTEETKGKSKGKEHTKESSNIFSIFKKPQIDKKIHDTQKTPTVTEIIMDTSNVDQLLQKEVDEYHDGRPVVEGKPIKQEETIQKESADIDTLEYPSQKKDETVVPYLSNEVLANMKESELFLNKECEKYHDVCSIVKKHIDKQDITKISGEVKKESKGILGVFKKSPEKNKRDQGVEIRDLKEAKPEISEQVIIDMKNTDYFLKQEVAKYHDVRPVVVKEKSPEPKMVKQGEKSKKESKGLLGLFKRSPEKKKKAKSAEKEIPKQLPLPLSEQVVRDIQTTDRFLKDEVEKYHDVHPIAKEKCHVPKIASKEEKSKGETIGIHETPEKKMTEKCVEKMFAKVKPAFSEQVIIDMIDTNQFLTEEVKNYHDVRPVIIAKFSETEGTKEKSKKESTGIWGIFKSPEKKKKEKSTEREPLSKTSPVLSAQVLKDMKNTNLFLEQEVEKYHDVRMMSSEMTEQEPQTREFKSILGLFKKSPEKKKREKSVDKEVVKDTKPVISKQVIVDMQNTDKFLKEEVEKYHDIRPFTEEKVLKPEFAKEDEIAKKGTPGILGMFKKTSEKKRELSAEKEAVKKTKPVLTEQQIIIDMTTSDRFLRHEVDTYEDARPTKGKSLELQAIGEDTPEKESRGVLGAFIKISDKKQEPEQVVVEIQNCAQFLQKEVNKYHDMRPVIELSPTSQIPKEQAVNKKSKIVLGIFKRDHVDVDKKIVKPKLSEEVIIDIQNSNVFLKEEVDKYHDVRPIVHKIISEPIKEQEAARKESKSTLEKFKIALKMKANVEESKLSEEALIDMLNSDNFLKTEVGIYHDVRPSEAKKEIKQADSREEEKLHKDSKGILGIFKKTHEKKQKDEKDTLRDLKILLSEQAIIDMKNTDNFLRQEVAKFHDVRERMGTEENESKSDQKLKEEAVQKETSGIFKLFKKSPKEKHIISEPSEQAIMDMQNTYQFLKDEVTNYYDVRPAIEKEVTKEEIEKIVISPSETKKGDISPELVKESTEKKENKGLFGIFKKKKKHHDEQKGSGKLSEETVKNMKQSHEFLEQEVGNFHDVRPIVAQKSKIESIQPKKEKSKFENSVFYTDVSEKIPETTNFLNTELDKYEDSEIKVKKVVSEGTGTYVPPKLSESALLDMITTSNFLREEVTKYHDVRPQIKLEEQTRASKEEPKEKSSKSGKFFGLFGKRKSQERENSVEKELEKPKKDKKKKVPKEEKISKKRETKQETSPVDQPHQLNLEPLIEGLIDSKNFLQGEIDRYHDARAVPQKVESKHEDKSGGLFEGHSKKTKPQNQTKEEPRMSGPDIIGQKDKSRSPEPKIIDTSEIRETIIDEKLKAKKISTVTQESSERGDKVVTVTKEIYMVDPRIMKDIADLDEDIKLKIEQARTEADSLDRDKSKPFVRENFSVETKIIDRIVPLVSERETCTETDVIYENVPVTVTRDTYTPFDDVLAAHMPKSVEDTKQFLLGEVTRYHDVKSATTQAATADKLKEKQSGLAEKIKYEPEETKKEVELETKSKRDHKKSESPFKIFEKKQKSIEQTSKLSNDEKENIQNLGTSKDKEKQTKTEKRKSGGFFSMFSKFPDDSSERDKKEERITHTSEITKTLQDTTNFLETEIMNYEDAKPVLVTDLDDEVDVEEHGKTGLFNIFSKKRESPKISKKLFKKHKKGKLEESSDIMGKTYQKLEDLDEAVGKTTTELQKQFGEDTTIIREGIESSEKGAKSLIDNFQKEAKLKKVAFTEFKNDSSNEADKAIQNGKLLIEKTKVSITDIEGLSVPQTEKLSENANEKSKEITEDMEQSKASEIEITKAHKKNKEFFTKLGENLSGKIEHNKTKMAADIENIETKSANVVSDVIYEAEKTAQNIQQEPAEKNNEIHLISKESPSSFISDMLQSFDSKMEYVKEESNKMDEIARDRLNYAVRDNQDFLQQVDEKYKETMELSQELAEKSKHKFSSDFLNSERRCLENEMKVARQDSNKVVDSPVKTLSKEMQETIVGTVECERDKGDKIIKDAIKSAIIFEKRDKKAGGEAKETEKSTCQTAFFAEKELEGLKSHIPLNAEKVEDVTNEKSKEIEIIIDGKTRMAKETVANVEEAARDVSQITDKGVQDAKSEVKEKISDTIEEKKQQIEEISKKGTEKSKDSKKKTTGFFTKLGDKISSKAKDVPIFIGKKEDSIGQEIQKCERESAETKEKFSEGKEIIDLETAVSKQDDERKYIKEKLLEEVKLIESSAKQNIDDFKSVIKQGDSRVRETLTQTVDNAADQAHDMMKEMPKKIAIEHDTGATKDDVKDLTAKENDVLEYSERISEIVADSKIKTDEADQDAKDARDAKKKTSGLFSKLGDKITGKVKDINKAATEGVKQSKKEIESKKSLVDATDKEASDIKNSVLELDDDIKQNLLERSNDVKEDISRLAGEVQESVKDMIAKTNDQKDLSLKITEDAEKVKGEAVEKAKKIRNVDLDISFDAEKLIERYKEDINQSIAHLINKENEAVVVVDDRTKEAKEKAAGFFSKLDDEITDKSKDAHSAVSETAEPYEEVLRKVQIEADEAKGKILGSLEQEISDIKFSVSATGEDVNQKASVELKEAEHKIDNLISEVKEGIDKAVDKIDYTQEEYKKSSLKTAESLQQAAQGNTDVLADSDALIEKRTKDLELITADVKIEQDESEQKNKHEANEAKKKTSGFFSKLGEKITGKGKEVNKSVCKSVGLPKERLENTKSEDTIVKDTVIGTYDLSKENKDIMVKEIKDTENVQSAFHDPLSEILQPAQTLDASVKTRAKLFKKLPDDVQDQIDAAKKAADEVVQSSKKNLSSSESAKPFEQSDKFLTEQLLGDHKLHLGQIKQRTAEFLEAESSDSLFGQIPRTVSDYGGAMKEPKSTRGSISEANIDLSNLSADMDKKSRSESFAYVTSPVLTRRAVSQRYPKGDRPDVVEIRNVSSDNIGDLDLYIVTEPEESLPPGKSRKPLFHIESEEDDFLDIPKKESVERSDSVKSNVLETLTEDAVDTLLSDLTKNLEAASKTDNISLDTTQASKEAALQSHIKESKVDVELIEQKLRDLDKALDFLEQVEPNKDDTKTEGKLKRVERKFERMASELLEEEAKNAKTKKLSTPDVEDKRESEFQRLVSQISTEEVSDFQREYSHLWDENTFSKSDDWESKTPDSQADVQELPKGEEQSQASGTQQKTGHGQAETEDSQGKSDKEKSKKVADQHRLSDEMRELLEEMEKESKQ